MEKLVLKKNESEPWKILNMTKKEYFETFEKYIKPCEKLEAIEENETSDSFMDKMLKELERKSDNSVLKMCDNMTNNITPMWKILNMTEQEYNDKYYPKQSNATLETKEEYIF